METTTDPTAAEIDEEQKRDWRDEFIENWANARLAHQALMLGRVQRQQAAEESLTGHVRGMAGVNKVSLNNGESDEMGVNVGNKNFSTNHFYLKTIKTGVGSLFKKAALGTALFGCGAGAGYIVSGFIDPPAPVGMVDTDTDTISVIDFPD